MVVLIRKPGIQERRVLILCAFALKMQGEFVISPSDQMEMP
jgi:hypothetical protein